MAYNPPELPEGYGWYMLLNQGAGACRTCGDRLPVLAAKEGTWHEPGHNHMALAVCLSDEEAGAEACTPLHMGLRIKGLSHDQVEWHYMRHHHLDKREAEPVPSLGFDVEGLGA